MASFISTIALLGMPMEGYQFGMMYVIRLIGYASGVPVAAYLLIPVFFKMQATSAYEVRPH